MPIERRPANPLPKSYIPSGGLLFKVSDNDDWRSVAQKFGIDVNTLIEFNFKTRNPDEVNWYLRERVGCRKMTNDGLNWNVQFDGHAWNHLHSSAHSSPNHFPDPALRWRHELDRSFTLSS